MFGDITYERSSIKDLYASGYIKYINALFGCPDKSYVTGCTLQNIDAVDFER